MNEKETGCDPRPNRLEDVKAVAEAVGIVTVAAVKSVVWVAKGIKR